MKDLEFLALVDKIKGLESHIWLIRQSIDILDMNSEQHFQDIEELKELRDRVQELELRVKILEGCIDMPF